MKCDYKVKKDFEEFLSCSGLIRKDKIKCYVYWVNKFLYYCKYRSHKPVNHNISSYLDKLEKDERIADWQVKQAADAVLIYIEKFLGQQKAFSSKITNSQIENQENCKTNQQHENSWEAVLNIFHKNIRLRHHSPCKSGLYKPAEYPKC